MPSRAARTRLPGLLMRSLRDLQAHGTGRALDHAHRGLDRGAIEILELLLGDFPHLCPADGGDGAASRSFRTAVDLRRLFQEIGDGRRAHFEGERAILIDGDDHRDRRVLLQILGLRIEGLAEFHDVQAALSQCGPDRGRGIGSARRDLQLEIAGDLLGHYSFSTCPNSSSTGVARPKIETATFTRERASSTSSTTPLKEANGPSDTRTCSPTSKVTDGFGRSMPSWT